MADQRPDAAQFRDRPEHPDFIRIAALVQALDLAADHPVVPRDQVLTSELGRHADVPAVSYTAIQRAFKALPADLLLTLVRGALADSPFVAPSRLGDTAERVVADLLQAVQVRGAALWMEGFLIGTRFGYQQVAGEESG
jgi:hypothetical protein